MKTNRNLYLFAAALVAGTMGMTSCSNEEITPDNVNPTYNGESVKTQFAINIPAAGKTRMTDNIVQETGAFRGMTNIKLIPFATKPTAGTESNLGQVISLTDIESLITTSNAKVYNDVTIPVGTGAVLFYGQAKATGSDDFVNGTVTAPTDYSVLSNVKFTPVNITTNTLDAKATALATWMTNVANAGNWSTAGAGTTLGKLRTEFLKATAGSSNSVLRLMQYLYDAVSGMATGGDVTATAIKTAITTETGVQESGGTLSYTAGSALAGYPENIKLPDGAAKVQWNTDKFEVVAAEGNTGLNAASLDSYVYPAPLCYYVNSTIKTADNAVELDKEETWTTIISGMSGNTVTASTRSIAINDAIDYGVGRLDLQIICGAERLPDSKDDGHNSSVVDVPDAGFTVTGVLIGGQGEVGWNFVPASAGTKTIYDKTMPSGMVADYATAFTGATTNYTLAFETVANTNVNVAIELVNNSGRDFYGYKGEIIPNEGKFYLVGTLTASAATETESKVFKQDYHTIAKFTINNLENAYNTLPDLRTAGLQLGLSVDLDWEEGHIFNVDIE